MQLADQQLAALRLLLTDILPANAFCRERLHAVGIASPDDVTSLEDFAARVPLTTKAELLADQTEHPPYGSNLTFPVERYTRFNQTSGSSGNRPLVCLDTPASWLWMLENWQRVYEAAGVSPMQRPETVYFAFSFGPFLGFWTAFEAALEMGCRCIPGGGLSSRARLQAILDHRATVLCCTPTYALRLAQVAREEGIDLRASAVRTIIVAGEPGGGVPAVRQQIEAAWGVPPFDHHGMTEVGPVTCQTPCESSESREPDQPGSLTILSDRYLAEVIDPATGSPVEPGSQGELVLTPLGREAWPLLRYRTGDLVHAPEASALGDVVLRGGILGRIDDMVVVRGVNIYPAAVDDVLRGISDIVEYRVTVGQRDELAELSVEVEPAAGIDPAGLAARAAEALRATFNLRIPVQPVPSDTLPRFEMKAKRWRRET